MTDHTDHDTADADLAPRDPKERFYKQTHGDIRVCVVLHAEPIAVVKDAHNDGRRPSMAGTLTIEEARRLAKILTTAADYAEQGNLEWRPKPKPAK